MSQITLPDYFAVLEIPTSTKSNTIVSSVREFYTSYLAHSHDRYEDGYPNFISALGYNNSQKVWVNNTGVGIGVSPRVGSTLDVNGTIYLANNSGMRTNGGTMTVGSVSAHSLYLTTNDANRITIDSDGRVGFGVATPVALVEISNAINGVNYLQLTSSLNIAWLKVMEGIRSNDPYWRMIQHYSGTDWDVLTFSLGNIGIGTYAPTSPLHMIKTYAYMTMTSTGVNQPAFINLNGSNGAGGWAMIGGENTSGGGLVGGSLANSVVLSNSRTNGPLHLGSSNLVRMTIDVNGQIGVNNTAPAYMFDVTGTGRFTSSVLIGGTLGVTGVTTLGTAGITIANITTDNITTANITTDNVTTLNVSGVTYLNGAINLGNGSVDDIIFNGRTKLDIIPKANGEYDLGAVTTGNFKNLYLSGTAYATTFIGALTGNVTGNVSGTAATLATARAINGIDFDGSAAITVPVNNTDDKTTNATMYPLWTATAGGNYAAKISTTKLTFNPSTGVLSATGFSGALTGNASTATSATTAGTVTTAAQPNITSVGTLTSLTSSGTVSGATTNGYAISGNATTTGYGVYGHSNSSHGIYGLSEGNNVAGVYGTGTSACGHGICGYASGVGGVGIIGCSIQDTAVYGQTSASGKAGVMGVGVSGGWGVYSNGTLYAAGLIQLNTGICGVTTAKVFCGGSTGCFCNGVLVSVT